MLDDLTKSKIKELVTKATTIKDTIAEQRDELYAVISELDEILESTKIFVDDFQSALDNLNGYL
jgi:ABC-type transporter Mla subunit MlaD